MGAGMDGKSMAAENGASLEQSTSPRGDRATGVALNACIVCAFHYVIRLVEQRSIDARA